MPSDKLDQMSVFANKKNRQLSINGTNKEFWRHFTGSFNGEENGYSFFLNGSHWPIVKVSTLNDRQDFTDTINIGHRGNKVFKGSIACIVYYQFALEPHQVKTLMQTCP